MKVKDMCERLLEMMCVSERDASLVDICIADADEDDTPLHIMSIEEAKNRFGTREGKLGYDIIPINKYTGDVEKNFDDVAEFEDNACLYISIYRIDPVEFHK